MGIEFLWRRQSPEGLRTLRDGASSQSPCSTRSPRVAIRPANQHQVVEYAADAPPGSCEWEPTNMWESESPDVWITLLYVRHIPDTPTSTINADRRKCVPPIVPSRSVTLICHLPPKNWPGP